MSSRMRNFQTLVRRYCINKINYLENERIIMQREALGIYEETRDKTQEQVIQAICEKIISLSYKEAMEIENAGELDKEPCNIKIDILEVILQSVEKIEPEQYSSLSEIKKDAIHLVRTSKISETISYLGWSGEDKERISESEINETVSYMKSIMENDLKNVSPIFYRRVLSEEEEGEVVRKLQDKWLKRTQQYYNRPTKEILSFNSNEFATATNQNKIIELLRFHGEEKIFEINACEVDAVSYIMDIDALSLNHNIQPYWCSNKMDWAIIKDHEDVIFVCGEFLVNAYNKGNHFGD